MQIKNMKKIIKLTESDLTNIVKRVIKENSAKDDLIQMIKTWLNLHLIMTQ
jgi:hypothetical protein